MGWFISQSLVFIVLAFILGVVAGRLWRNAPEKPTEPPAEPDRLERIEGIGPAMADALRAAGISTFTQLADSDDDTKRTAIKAAGLSFAPSLPTWSRQARLLADGDEAAFAVLTARLIAGRDTDHATPRPTPKPTIKPTPAAAPPAPETATPAPTADAAAPSPGSAGAALPPETAAPTDGTTSRSPESPAAPTSRSAAPFTESVAPVTTAPAGTPSARAGSPSGLAGDSFALAEGPSAPTGITLGRAEEPSRAVTAGEYSEVPSARSVTISAGQPHILATGSEISDSSGAAGTVAVLARAGVIPAEEKAGDTATDKAGTDAGNNTRAEAGSEIGEEVEIKTEITAETKVGDRAGNSTVNKSGGPAGNNTVVEKNADERGTESSDQKADDDKTGTLVVSKNGAPKKADRKKNENRKNDRKNDGKKGDRKKPGRDSEATNR